jgi:hypothetical protein
VCPISSREGGAIRGYFWKIESKGIDHILQSNVFLDLLFYMYVLSIVVCSFTVRVWGHYVLCYCTYLRRIWSVFLHVSEETDVLCYCTYLRRLCSLLLHVSDETMFCVTARISKHMYDQFTIQTSWIQVSKIHFLITYISYKCLILAYIINHLIKFD